MIAIVILNAFISTIAQYIDLFAVCLVALGLYIINNNI